MVKIKRPTVIICDIEGTTTSMRFWGDVLSPFIKDNIDIALNDTWGNQETIDVITLLRNETNDAIQNGENIPRIASEDCSPREIIDSVVKNVVNQMAIKRHSNELKAIQLLVWLYGYQNDLLRGHVYEDVQPSFQRWSTEFGIRIFTFASSISIAQKLLFACSISGNLTHFIEDHFDADTVGRKVDADSFINIAKKIHEKASHILFLSDNKEELNAAQSSGLNSILVIRSHNEDMASTEMAYPFKFIKNFEDIEFV